MTCSDASASPARRARPIAALQRTPVGAVLVRAGRAIRWYMTSLMGDRAYEAYAIHRRAHHPDAPLLTERQFWRERMDEQSRNPGARCC